MKEKKSLILGVVFNIFAFMIFNSGLMVLREVSGFEPLFSIGCFTIFLTGIFAMFGAICSYKSFIITALLSLLVGFFTFANAGFFFMIFIMSFFIPLIIGFMIKKGRNQKEIIIYGAPLGIISYLSAIMIYCYDKFGNNFFSLAYEASVKKLSYTLSKVIELLSNEIFAGRLDKTTLEAFSAVKDNVGSLISGYGLFIIISVFVFFFLLLRVALGIGPLLNSDVKPYEIGDFQISKGVTCCYIIIYLISIFLGDGVLYESVNYAVIVFGFIYVLNSVCAFSNWLKKKRVPAVVIEMIAFILIIIAQFTISGGFFSAYYLLMLIGVYVSLMSDIRKKVIK